MTQFQTEMPPVAGSHPRHPQRWDYSTTNETSLQPGWQALLLGLHLRGRLCDREKDWLDRMAPERHLTFLLLGDQYLHPQNFDLFPEDVTSGLTALGAEAISYARLRPEGDNRVSPLGVHTSRIGSYDDQALVLGIAGPDTPHLRAESDHRFARLVDLARQAERRVAPVAARLRDIVRGQTPAIVILRASGRVLAVNSAMEELLGQGRESLVDQEWGTAKQRLAALLPTSSITLESVADGDLSVAVMRLRSRAKRHDAKAEFESFLDAVQHRVAAVAASARHLKSLSCCIPGEINSELVRIIQEEAEELQHSFACLRVVDSFATLPAEACDPAAELRRCVNRSLQQQRQRHIALVLPSEGALRCSAPRPALSALFDALITAHSQGMGRDERTDITLGAGPNRDGLTIHFISHGATMANGAAAQRSAWLAYADKLSAHLGWLLNHRRGEGSALISELELTNCGAAR